MKLIQFFLCLLSFALFGTEGIEYTRVTLPNSSYLNCITGTQSIHVIDIDPSLCTIKPVKALDNGIGRESVLSLSTRHGAIAAINSGFFSIGGTFDGKACGTLKINDWYALPAKPRGCIGWSSTNQNPIMDRLLVRVFGTYNQDRFPIDGLNRPRKDGEIVFFTSNFHRTTLTNPDGEELILSKDLIKSVESKGSTKIPEEGGVLSIQANHTLFHAFTAGSPLTITTEITPLTGATTPEEWESLDYIVGGTPLLLYNSAKIVNFSPELTLPTFLSNKHARTAIGILPNNHWILVVVDKTTSFDGMTMDELRNLMAQLGCVHALNLDGGGSSTMVYEGQIVNSPHGDEDEGANQSTIRRVSDAILVLSKQQLSL